MEKKEINKCIANKKERNGWKRKKKEIHAKEKQKKKNKENRIIKKNMNEWMKKRKLIKWKKGGKIMKTKKEREKEWEKETKKGSKVIERKKVIGNRSRTTTTKKASNKGRRRKRKKKPCMSKDAECRVWKKDGVPCQVTKSVSRDYKAPWKDLYGALLHKNYVTDSPSSLVDSARCADDKQLRMTAAVTPWDACLL